MLTHYLKYESRSGVGVEQGAREPGTVSRSQNAVYVMPHDWTSIAQFLGPLVERLDVENRDLQLLVVTPDADVAAAVAAAAVKLVGERDLQLLAATSAGRAARLIKQTPPGIIAGTASTIVELMRSASIKLESVKHICIAWADELLARDGAEALESVMTEVPKDASRTIVTAELSPAIEEIIERYARRARRVAAPAAEGAQPTPIEYVATSTHARFSALRRVLDEIDPSSAMVFVRESNSARDLNDLLRSLGYGIGGAVSTGLAAQPGTSLVVLFDLPASREELREAVGAAARVIALVQPRQLASVRALAAGGAVKPLTLPESGQRARDFDARIRAELRAALDEQRYDRALLAIEPLLEDFDGAEVAAAALVLLEREREARKAAVAAVPLSQREPGSTVRLFVSVGARDNARPGDLVGAMANQGGISSSEIGKVDVRESHSVIEVSANVADALIERVNGTTIKGRRAVVRRDEGVERAPRGDRKPPREDRGAPRGGPPRGDRRPPRPRREGRE